MRSRRAITYAATTIVAGIAAYASYSHMRELALHHGQTPSVAALLPVSVDGMLIVATMAMREDRDEGHPVRPWARSAFLLGVVASVAANVLAAQPTLTARLISAWPALALLLVVEVLNSRRHRITEPPVSHAEPLAESTPALVTAPPPEPSATRSVAPRRRVQTGSREPAQKRVTPRSLTAAQRVIAAHESTPGATHADLAEKLNLSVSTVKRHRPSEPAQNGSPSAGLPAQTSPVDGLTEPAQIAAHSGSDEPLNGSRQTDLLDSLVTA